MAGKALSLNGGCKLMYAKNSDWVRSDCSGFTTKELMCTGFPVIPAEIPGNIEQDLERAGILQEIFFGVNVMAVQSYESYHFFYCRSFCYSEVPAPELFLCFEGIDTVADIYLNGKKIGCCSNMLIPHEFPALGLVQGDNDLVVHIKPCMLESRNYPLTVRELGNDRYIAGSLAIRKAPHSYGWDIAPRLLLGGIWKGVSIIQKQDDAIESLYLYTTALSDSGNATVSAFFELTVGQDEIRDYTLNIEGRCQESSFAVECPLWHTSGTIRGIVIPNAKRWEPKFYGDPNLYDVTARLYYQGVLCAEKRLRFGVRVVALTRSSTTTADGEGEFCFYVNHHKVFLLGTNWVPLDALHARDADRLPMALTLLKEIGCNAVRCWGGNVYESDAFYDFCDENGILVWQDFAMACAIYPQDERFQRMLVAEAENVVKRLRGHASLLVWAGDNECDQVCLWTNQSMRDPNENILTRKVLPDVLHRLDPTRPYLPSSPYVDKTAFQTGAPLPEDHTWGPRDYFKGEYYKNTACHFASEAGYHGCPSPQSLKRFLAPDELWPICEETTGDPKPGWLAHAVSPELNPALSLYGYRIPLMMGHVKTLFGKEMANLHDFALASQISQGEAMKYLIERYRITKWRRTGIIWWNLIDCWPQISDAVVDYYGVKKVAYHYIRRVQQPVCLSFDEPDGNGRLALYCLNDTQQSVSVDYTVTDLASGKAVLQGVAEAGANESARVCMLPLNDIGPHYYLITWSDGQMSACNHYVTGMPGLDFATYVQTMTSAGLLAVQGFEA